MYLHFLRRITLGGVLPGSTLRVHKDTSTLDGIWPSPMWIEDVINLIQTIIISCWMVNPSPSSIFIPVVLTRLCLPDSQRPWRSVRHRAIVSVRVLQKRNAKRTGGTADRRWRERHSHEARLPLGLRPDGEERWASRSQAIDGLASQARHQRHDLTTLKLSLPEWGRPHNLHVFRNQGLATRERERPKENSYISKRCIRSSSTAVAVWACMHTQP